MGAGPDRVLGVMVGGIVVVAVVAAVVGVTRPTTTWDRGTPEGAVQAYLSAVTDRDTQEAATYLSPRSPCDVQDLDRAAMADVARVDLVDSTVEAGSARVEVEIALSTGGGPFDTYPTERHTLRLTQSDDHWLVVGVPWPLYDCGGGVT